MKNNSRTLHSQNDNSPALSRRNFVAATAMFGVALAGGVPLWSALTREDAVAVAAPGDALKNALVLSPPRSAQRLAVPLRASAFALQDVRLLPGVFKTAQDVDHKYLLSLEIDRLTVGMLRTSGLPVKGEAYGGWEKGGSGIIGHYLSACAQMQAATGDPELKKRVDYTVSEMARAQKANGNGGLFGFENDKNNWFPALAKGEVKDMNVAGWYVTHKYMAGLRDAWFVAGNAQAREVLLEMCDWAVDVTKNLTPQDWEKMFHMGISEFGAPHEILADAYAATGDEKYLRVAKEFEQKDIVEPLAKGDISPTTGVHANAAIAKYLGYERIHELTGEPIWFDASRNFYDDVVQNRSWANGGNSQWEHFFAHDAEPTKIDEICGPETCNSYNMLKLAGQFYALDANPAHFDFYERALYNSILPTLSPDGNFVYYTPQRPGHYRVFSLHYDAFWCCVGTGMENHAKYGELIYARQNDRLMVNLFIASELNWREKGLKLRQQTAFPNADNSTLILTLDAPQTLTLSVRYPGWIAPGALKIRVNGEMQTVTANPDSYVDITRDWKTGDRVEVTLPMQTRVEMLPGADADNQHAAFFYGPILLAGKLGTQGLKPENFLGGSNVLQPKPGSAAGQLAHEKLPISDFPVVLTDATTTTATAPAPAPAQLAQLLVPVDAQKLRFQLNGTNSAAPVILAPFYDVVYERYSTYWPVMNAAQFAAFRKTEQAEFAYNAQQAAEENRADLKDVTIDRVFIGDIASEAAHHFASDQSSSGGTGDGRWRDAKGFMSYEMKVVPDAPVAVRIRYYGGDEGRQFDVLVDGQVIATQQLAGKRAGAALFGVYPLPPELTRGKQSVMVRLQPKPGSVAGGVFDLRTIRADENTQLLQ